MYTCIHTYIYVHIHIYMYIHTYIHICVFNTPLTPTPTATSPSQPPPPPTTPTTISRQHHQQDNYNINRVCSTSGSLQHLWLLAAPLQHLCFCTWSTSLTCGPIGWGNIARIPSKIWTFQTPYPCHMHTLNARVGRK